MSNAADTLPETDQQNQKTAQVKKVHLLEKGQVLKLKHRSVAPVDKSQIEQLFKQAEENMHNIGELSKRGNLASRNDGANSSLLSKINKAFRPLSTNP